MPRRSTGVALITGCSTGIGRATATMLTRSGYDVVVTARRHESLEGLEVALGLELDVTDAASIDAAVGAAVARFGRIDALVNNAGYALRGAVEECDQAEVGRMFDVNVVGLVRMVQAVVPHMRRAGFGRIVNIGSIGGRIAAPGYGAYAATKFGVEALTDVLRLELRPFGIAVSVIEPGEIRSEFERTARGSSDALFDRPGSPYARLYQHIESVDSALRRREQGPEVVARAVLGALRARQPRARYTAAVQLPTRLTVLLPASGRELVMRRIYGAR